MDELDVLETFLTDIETDVGLDAISAFNIEDYDGDDVIIDSWNTERVRRATNTYKRTSYDNSGMATGEIHHFYYRMRVDLKVFSEDEQRAMENQRNIVNHFRKYESNPKDFHEDVALFEVGSGGNREPMMEATSLRQHQMVQSFELDFVDADEIQTHDPIENVDLRLEVNETEIDI